MNQRGKEDRWTQEKRERIQISKLNETRKLVPLLDRLSLTASPTLHCACAVWLRNLCYFVLLEDDLQPCRVPSLVSGDRQQCNEQISGERR